MSLVNFITEHWCKSSLFNIFLTVFSEVIVTSMNIYNATIHISIGKHRISHIRHFLHSSKPVKSDLSVDAVVTLLSAGAVPWGFDKSRCNSIDGAQCATGVRSITSCTLDSQSIAHPV